MARKNKGKPRLAPEGGWGSKTKTVASEVNDAPTGKHVRSLDLDAEDIKDRRPVWRFADLDDDGPWSLSACEHSQLRDIFAKLKDFERMTIGEIFKPGSEHGKTYEVESLPKQARSRLIEIERDDETELARLRFAGRRRFYGVLREHVFHVLWWDPEHTVVPSKKKHT